MTRTVSIDFVSDVVCPWCALAVTALDQAIGNLAGQVAVELTFKPFELNPDMPAEGENAVRHMMRKYGRSAEQVASRNEMIIARGEAIGFKFDLEKRSHFYNTFDAHRLLLWAVEEGLQVALNKVLTRAYFTDGQDISEQETLVRLAGEAGLSSAGARQVLAEGTYATEVRELERFYHQRGIDSVPAMVVNGRQLITGSQSVEHYEQVLRQLAQEPAEA
ncbi:putative DsbA family dithiol-disulfide isomerase [Pseudomonas brassicacearum]|uniref:DsbA family dithiol-disulfide isomerase n=1 Tax=Pseudomonas brassicacearum TaxID=930166 RepID=A0AAW8M4Z4_9PSED|nr:DsbA family oxidoreductase [Pseudomonas brassicacearum]MDR6956800.1 putative DsbA family dithiol-disulfide isomerase [Pseudomonas brassicacearum]